VCGAGSLPNPSEGHEVLDGGSACLGLIVLRRSIKAEDSRADGLASVWRPRVAFFLRGRVSKARAWENVAIHPESLLAPAPKPPFEGMPR